MINFDVPESAELLTHRLGRTGRMGRQGMAVTLVTPADRGKWRQIERQIGIRINRQRWGEEEPNEGAAAEKEAASAPRQRSRGGNRRPERTKHTVTCAACQRETTVPFAPSADRPVYCNACYRERKESAA